MARKRKQSVGKRRMMLLEMVEEGDGRLYIGPDDKGRPYLNSLAEIAGVGTDELILLQCTSESRQSKGERRRWWYELTAQGRRALEEARAKYGVKPKQPKKVSKKSSKRSSKRSKRKRSSKKAEPKRRKTAKKTSKKTSKKSKAPSKRRKKASKKARLSSEEIVKMAHEDHYQCEECGGWTLEECQQPCPKCCTGLAKLTKNQREILKYMAMGCTKPELSKRSWSRSINSMRSKGVVNEEGEPTPLGLAVAAVI